MALKLESLQPTGSFKVRGALAALAALDPALPIVTASAGNHALGVAYAAARLGRRATVVTATTASAVKVAAIRRFGVDLVQVGATYDEAEAHALALAEHGAHYVSPYNDPYVIAGQASIGFELGAQIEGPITVVCGIGGGGLGAGLGLWASTRPDTQVIGVEAAVSRAVSAAVRAGGQVPVEVGDTLADGMAGNIEPGSVTVDLIAAHVAELVAVSEADLRHAIRHLALERGVVAEASGAAPLAAILAGRVADDSDRTLVAVISGRNINPSVLSAILADDEG